VALYASERWGHFSYALPFAEGRYRVTMKFCEGHYGKRNTAGVGVGSRLFDVYCNGVALLRGFDIFKEAGGEGVPSTELFRHTAQRSGKDSPHIRASCGNGLRERHRSGRGRKVTGYTGITGE
jgi:hypothetical protein